MVSIYFTPVAAEMSLTVVVLAWDPKSPYYDPKSDKEKPKWFCPLVEFREKFGTEVPLDKLKSEGQPGKSLAEMQLLKLSRLSVSKVSNLEWEHILALAKGG